MATNVLSMPVREAVDDTSSAFVNALLVCLLLLAVPIRNSAYLIPPIFIAMQLLFNNVRFVYRTVLCGAVLVCVSGISLLIDALGGSDVNGPGLVLAIFTYAPIAIMFGLSFRFAISPADQRPITKAVAWFVIIQSVLGLMQLAVSGNPDAVAGTFGLLDFRLDSFRMGQVHLSFNLFAMVLYLLTDMKGLLEKSAIAFGLLTCSLAHSGHQTLFLIAALALVAMMNLRARQFMVLAFLLVAVMVLTATISTIHWAHVESWYQRVIHGDASPKKDVTVAATQVVSSPKTLLLGTGMGQYTSRASLMTSGEYLAVELPSVIVGQSEYYRTFVQPAHYDSLKDAAESSVMTKPYYSILSVIVELGVPLTLLMGLALARQVLQNHRLARAGDRRTQIVGSCANVGLIFFVLCCSIENYLELPQATFLPMLLYVVARASVDNERRRPPWQNERVHAL